jgi:hypothetical protein
MGNKAENADRALRHAAELLERLPKGEEVSFALKAISEALRVMEFTPERDKSEIKEASEDIAEKTCKLLELGDYAYFAGELEIYYPTESVYAAVRKAIGLHFDAGLAADLNVA